MTDQPYITEAREIVAEHRYAAELADEIVAYGSRISLASRESERMRCADLESLVADLSVDLTDEGGNWSVEGLHNMRCRVANALPKADCPDWLLEYRDAEVVQFPTPQSQAAEPTDAAAQPSAETASG